MGLFKRKPKDPEIEAAYQRAYKAERIKVATARGIRDANRKPMIAQLGQGLVNVGKGVFFGYDGSPLVANLKTLVHADLRAMKEIIPATISRTQLSALNKWSEEKGYAKRGGETTKVIILAIAVIGVIASIGIIAYLLLNGGKAPI